MMLTLPLLLAMGAVNDPPRVVTLPRRSRPAAMAARAGSTAKARPAKARQPLRRATIGTNCLSGSCAVSPGNARYRVADTPDAGWSGKMDVVKATGIPCGVQGAPVCPKGGRQLVRTSID